MNNLAGKILVLVGGTSGLGGSAARACVAAGAKVVIVGRQADKVAATLSELGGSAAGLTADATRPATAEEAVQLALKKFGGFHGLYHVAGGSGRRRGDGPFHEITDQGWHYTLEQNLTSLFYSNRAAARQFLQQGGGGSVLNMGSVLGFSPSPKFFSTQAYATSKAAIIGLTKSAAAQYAGEGIRFNVLAPALVVTLMSERAQGDESVLQFIKTKQPLDGGRIGQPTDLDAAVVFFLSDASKFVTGQVLAVDGGWSVSEGQCPVPSAQ